MIGPRDLLNYLKPTNIRWRLANQTVTGFNFKAHDQGFCSQYGQDAFVVDLYDRKRGGVFVDIGANDGVSLSNSYYLEKELGWTGLLVEPHPLMFQRLKESRSAYAVNACAADHDGVVRFAQIEGANNVDMLSGVLSNYSAKHRRRVKRSLKKTDGVLREIEAPAVRINRILDEQGIEQVDYLSIDTEGGELEIVDAIDLDRYHIGCVGMENNSKSLEVRRYMADRGYRLAAVLGCDEMFVRPEIRVQVSQPSIKRAA